MKDEKLLTAGQFAKMLHIDRHLLNTYDKLALFQPKYRENNGHKWYSLGQINDWQICNSLWMNSQHKFINLDKNYDYQTVLREQQNLLETKIKQLIMVRDRVLASLMKIDAYYQTVIGCIMEVDRTSSMLSVTSRTKTSSDMTSLIMKHINRYVTDEIMSVPIVIGQRVNRKQSIVDAVYTQLTNNYIHDPDVILPAGRYLLSYRSGDQNLEAAFQAIENYAHDHQLSLDSSFYQTPIQLTMSESPLAPKIVEILIKISS